MKLLILVTITLLATFAMGANSTGSSSRQAKAFRMADSRSSVPSSSSSSSSSSEKPLASNEISQFLNTKNIVKTIVKLVFGTSEESTATSRQVLNLLVKVLDMLKTSFTQRNARSSGGSRGLKDTADDAAVAGISMLKGFVRSALTAESTCMQRHICDAAAAASRESRELGYLIAQVGGYASSYVLDGQKGATPNASYEAARIGRSGADCKAVYSSCVEKQEL